VAGHGAHGVDFDLQQLARAFAFGGQLGREFVVVRMAALGEQGYAIVRVLKAATESDELAAPLRAQYAPAVQQSVAQAQVQAYLNSIKPQLKVKINVPKPAVPQNLQHAAE